MRCVSDQTLAAAIRFRREGGHGEAEAALRQEVLAEPGNARTCQLLGAALHETGRTDEAVAWLRRAVELEPASAAFRCNLAAGPFKRDGHGPFKRDGHV